jgi:hypothetical protein
MFKKLAKWLIIFSLLALFVYTFIHPLLIPIDHLKKEVPERDRYDEIPKRTV